MLLSHAWRCRPSILPPHPSPVEPQRAAGAAHGVTLVTAVTVVSVVSGRRGRRSAARAVRLPSPYSAEKVAEACGSDFGAVLGRVWQILRRCGAWLLAEPWRRPEDARLAAELRHGLVDLGPSFVKVGQLLSSRVDLLPSAYITELGRLTDRVAAFPSEEAEATLKEAWQDAPVSLQALPKEPVAAASLGQVYRLTLQGYGEVAVKVQRPGIRPQICIDLYILRFVSAWVQKWFDLNTDLPSLVDEYGARLVDELDFTLEAQRAETFCRAADQLVPDAAVTAARPVLELTTSSVLVTEWVCGERLELTAARDLEEAQRLQAVAMTSYLAMLLETGSLHADPHWGNLLRREDGVLVIIDWGLVADISEALRQQILRYIAHILANDYSAIPADLVFATRTSTRVVIDFCAAFRAPEIGQGGFGGVRAKAFDFCATASLARRSRKTGFGQERHLVQEGTQEGFRPHSEA